MNVKCCYIVDNISYILHQVHVIHISLRTCKPRSHQIANVPNDAVADTSAVTSGVPEQSDEPDDGADFDSPQHQDPDRNDVNASAADSSTVRSLEDAHRILVCRS